VTSHISWSVFLVGNKKENTERMWWWRRAMLRAWETTEEPEQQATALLRGCEEEREIKKGSGYKCKVDSKRKWM
jgi:hypothetical protein